MIQYEHIVGNRRSVAMSDDAGVAAIGKRLMSGFECWQEYVTSPTGQSFSLVVFQDEVTGIVWAVYYDL